MGFECLLGPEMRGRGEDSEPSIRRFISLKRFISAIIPEGTRQSAGTPNLLVRDMP